MLELCAPAVTSIEGPLCWDRTLPDLCVLALYECTVTCNVNAEAQSLQSDQLAGIFPAPNTSPRCHMTLQPPSHAALSMGRGLHTSWVIQDGSMGLLNPMADEAVMAASFAHNGRRFDSSESDRSKSDGQPNPRLCPPIIAAVARMMQLSAAAQ